MRRRHLAALAAALALPAPPARAQISLRDAAGRAVTLPRPPARILLAFNFEEFIAVAGPGGWDRVVGFNRRQWAINRPAVWREYLKVLPGLEQLPDIGATENQTLTAERCLALRPDLLVVHAVGVAAVPQEIARIEAAGVPVLVVDYNAQTPELHAASTRALGAALGQPARAEALAALYAGRVTDIRARAARAGTSPSAYVEIGSGGPGSFGNSYNGVMWGGMLDLLGARNIAAGRIPRGWAPMAPEAVLASAPEHVFLLGSSWQGRPHSVRAGYGVTLDEARASLRPYAGRPGWAGLPAIRSGSLHTIETGLSRCLMDWIALAYMGRALHPAAFEGLDPDAALAQYHADFLPVPMSGCWMARVA
jgi:ABC-type Fe3+-hydroxamate transport system substrate-binding protein